MPCFLKESTMDWVTPEFGILCLGIFVGAILGYGLVKAGGELKAALTVVGAAVGGAPILFIQDIGGARFTDPVGLVLGLLVIRLRSARETVIDKRISRTKRAVAWMDTIVIIAVTLAAAIWSAIPAG